MANDRRRYRVAQQIRSTLATFLIHSPDSRFGMVTLTSVALSPDLKIAKIYWVVTGGPARISEATEAFEAAKKFFRKEMGKKLELRFVPELRFFYDDTLDTVDEVDRLLERAKASGDQKE